MRGETRDKKGKLGSVIPAQKKNYAGGLACQLRRPQLPRTLNVEVAAFPGEQKLQVLITRCASLLFMIQRI